MVLNLSYIDTIEISIIYKLYRKNIYVVCTISKEMDKETKINIVRYITVIIMFSMIILYHIYMQPISNKLKN